MNQSILFDIANRLSHIENHIDQNRYLCNDITILQITTLKDHEAILDTYKILNKILERLDKTDTIISDMNRRLHSLEKLQEEVETLKTRLNTQENQHKKVDFKK